jgi:ribosomal protein L23
MLLKIQKKQEKTLIEKEVHNILNEKVKKIAIDNLEKISQGTRDFRF